MLKIKYLLLFSIFLFLACTKIDVSVKEYSKEYDYLHVTFKVINSGNTTVEYYEIYYKFRTTDGDVLSDWTNDVNLPPGETRYVEAYSYVGYAGVTNVWVDHVDY